MDNCIQVHLLHHVLSTTGIRAKNTSLYVFSEGTIYFELMKADKIILGSFQFTLTKMVRCNWKMTPILFFKKKILFCYWLLLIYKVDIIEHLVSYLICIPCELCFVMSSVPLVRANQTHSSWGKLLGCVIHTLYTLQLKQICFTMRYLIWNI